MNASTQTVSATAAMPDGGSATSSTATSSTATSGIVIETHELTRTYMMGSTQVNALRDASFTVTRGEFVALMGPSGSGKSTLMHLLGCLDRPTSGQYILEGTSVDRLSEEQRARVRNRRIGFVFQSFNLLNRMNTLENVGLPLLYGANDRNWQERAKQALKRVGLGKRLWHRPNELSGGERQRVAIARALVHDPALILADEPTGNLDSANGDEIMRLLVELCREGRTLLMVTHDAHCASYASRIITMRDGRMIAGGD
jgi:putative ABC transport system ATP-binding protein